MRFVLLVLGLTVSSAAYASPVQFAHQGRLLDTVGTPINGTHPVDFVVYNAAGDNLFSEPLSVAFEGGYYSVVLGADEALHPLESAVFDGTPRFLGIAINSVEMLPRLPIGTVPHAVFADQAGSVSASAVLDVAGLNVGGQSVIDGAGNLTYSGTITHGTYDQRYDYPFYRISHNQLGTLSGTGRVNWNNNVGVRWYVEQTIVTGTPFASRSAGEQEILTAMGMAGVQHFQPNIVVTRLEWDSALSWVSYPTAIWAPGTVTMASYCKSRSGAVLNGTWAAGMTTSWGLCGSHSGPNSPGTYIHAHPSSGGAGSALVIWPGVVAGNFPLDTASPKWGYWPHQNL